MPWSATTWRRSTSCPARWIRGWGPRSPRRWPPRSMRPATSIRRVGPGLIAGLLVLALAACGGQRETPGPSMVVGAGPDPQSELLANLYAAALGSYGTPAHVDRMP